MKKFLSIILLLAVIIITGTGCLKDKGFEDYEYGINDPDTQPPGIGFPQGKNAINARGISFVNTVQTIADPVVSLFATDPAPVDLHVNLVENNTLITDYNTANGTSFIPLPQGTFTTTGLKVTIPKGERFGQLVYTIPDATKLDPLASYAVAYTVASVDESGFTIADNLKNILLSISVKNKYDGIFTFKATYDFPADRDPAFLKTFTYPFETELLTTGPMSVTFLNDAFGTGFLPLMTPAASGFGATGLDIVFDANDNVISVNNPVPDARNRQFSLIPNGNSRYDAAAKTLFLEIYMTQNGLLPIPMHIQMIYKRAR